MATQKVDVRIKRSRNNERKFEQRINDLGKKRAYAHIDDSFLDEEELGIDAYSLANYNVHPDEDGVLQAEFIESKSFGENISAAFKWASYGMGEYRTHESRFEKDCYHLHEVGTKVRYAHVYMKDGQWWASRRTDIQDNNEI